jgi:phosphatidylglycerophosphatase A
MKKLLVKILASGLGSGYSPLASGTAGTLVAALVYWFVFPRSPVLFWWLAAAVLLVSVPVSTAAEKLYGKKDDGHIVIDEVIGFWISVAFLPYSLKVTIAAFFLFRLFDVIKPFFIRKVQSWHGGWGVVADDVFAALLTNIVLQIARYLVRFF